MSPAMMRSSVDLPEPEGPSNETISPSARRKSTPSSTGRAVPSAERNDLPTASSSMIALLTSVTSEMHAILGETIEAPPEEVVHGHDKNAHHADAERDAREVARRRHLRDIAAEPLGAQRRVAPGHVFGDDAGVPRTTA